MEGVCVVDGSRYKLTKPAMPLQRPTDPKEKGWEAVFKHGCTFVFEIPKKVTHLSVIRLEVRGLEDLEEEVGVHAEL